MANGIGQTGVGIQNNLPRASTPAVSTGGDGSFFEAALSQAESLLIQPEEKAAAAVEEFSRGGQGELHETLIAVEKADISFKFMMNVRNKVVDAYREVMRMGA